MLNTILRFRQGMCFIGCCLIMVFGTQGCAPLRKKFIRQKKKDKKEKFIPVLDPIDYPPPRTSNAQQYNYHYSMWQVWSRDLIQLLEGDGAEKRKQYLMTQVLQQLDELSQWIPARHSDLLKGVVEEYEQIQKDLNKPESMIDKHMLIRELERCASKIRNNLKPKMIFEAEE